MGPRCSSAETQFCHRSYISAAIMTHIPLKFKEKIWAREFIELVYDTQFNGELG